MKARIIRAVESPPSSVRSSPVGSREGGGSAASLSQPLLLSVDTPPCGICGKPDTDSVEVIDGKRVNFHMRCSALLMMEAEPVIEKELKARFGAEFLKARPIDLAGPIIRKARRIEKRKEGGK